MARVRQSAIGVDKEVKIERGFLTALGEEKRQLQICGDMSRGCDFIPTRAGCSKQGQ